ncbi:MAG: CHASE3 domain-containing protein [Gallionella sp.]|nr:CHASE3 domain-containing protein [Gallionella sp.]
MKTTSKIAVWFGGAGLLVALMALWSFSAVRQSGDSAAWQKHTLMVMAMADDFLSGLKDAETAQRGYLLTGEETYLEPYLTARDRVAPQLAELRRFTQDNPAQQHRLDVLAQLIEKRLALLTQTIALRRDQHTGDALKILRSGRGKQLMDGIRVEMRDFNKMEKGLLAQRDARYSANLRQLLLLIATTSMLVVILTFISVYLEPLAKLCVRVEFMS